MGGAIDPGVPDQCTAMWFPIPLRSGSCAAEVSSLATTPSIPRAALVVIDMQNHFVAEGFPAEVPLSREIVPTINRLARAMRIAGGQVVWVQTTATGALEHWANHHKYMLTPRQRAARLASLDEGAEGFKLYSVLEPL